MGYDNASSEISTAAAAAAEALATKGAAALLAQGTDLADASVTVNPGTDAVSAYTMPAATQTTNRVITLGTTGTLIAGVSTAWVARRDLTANTLTIRNGGANGTAISDVVLPANPGKPMMVGATWDGVDWIPHTVVFIR